MKKTYKLLIFDFDGTLVDTVRDIAHYANGVLREHGFSEGSVDQVRDAIGWGVHELLKTLAPPFEKDLPGLDRAVEIFKERYRQTPVLSTRPFEGVSEVLSGPLSKVSKAIVTNKPQDITTRILDELGLTASFDLVIGMQAGFPFKPDPAAARHVMSKLGASASETLMIGDSVIDLEMSRNAGIDFGWVSYGYDRKAGERADWCFSRPYDWERLAG